MIRGRRRAWLAGLALSSLFFSAAPATAVASEGPDQQVQPLSTGVTFNGTVDLSLHDEVGDYSIQLWQLSGGFHKVGSPVPVDSAGQWSIPDLAIEGFYYVELIVAPGAPVLGGFYAGAGKPLSETYFNLGSVGPVHPIVVRPVPTGKLTVRVNRAPDVTAGGTTEITLYERLPNSLVAPTMHVAQSAATDPTFVLPGLRAGKEYVIHLANDGGRFIEGYYSRGAAGLLTGYTHATWVQPGETVDVTVSSAYVSPVIQNITPPSISGTPAVGETLTGNPGTWEGTTQTHLSWFRDGAQISGATSSQYTLTPADVGARISLRVLAQRLGFENGTMFSDPVGPIDKGQAPTPADVLVIAGTPEVGEELSVEPSTWSIGDTTSTFQWFRDGAAIDGATTATYELVPTDFDTEVFVRETATHAGYLDGVVESAPVTVARGAAPSAIVLPQVTGSARVGSTVTVTGATWDVAGTQSAFQWLRDGELIESATGATYVLTPADVDSEVAVRETVTHAAYRDGVAESAAVPVTPGEAPSASAPPRVVGTVRVGSTVTVSPATWTLEGTQSTFQWLRDGAPIAGATGDSYTLTTADLGAALSVRESAALPAYLDAQADSAAVKVDAGAAPAVSKAAVVSGAARLGSKLKVSAPVWDAAGVTTTYQWLRNGTPIKGATKVSYRATKADVGKRLSVRVTGTRSGYQDGAATSSSTKAVAKAKAKVTARVKNAKVGKRAKVTVRVKAAGLARPKGTVTVKYGKKSVKVKLKASKKGKVTVRLPKLKKGKYKITVRFAASLSTKKYVTKPKATKVNLRVK